MTRGPHEIALDDDSSPQESGPFEQIVEEARYAIYVTDADGTITYVNPAFEDITGYTADEAVGETPAILNSGETPGEYFERLWETITAGEVWEEEITNRRKSGERYTAHQTIAPVRENGEVRQFVAIQTDVTEQKERQEALARSYDLVAETEQLAGVGGWELTLDTATLRWTAGTRRIHEVADDYELSLAAAIEFYHPEDRDRVERAFEYCRDYGTSYDMEARLVTAEGHTRWVRVTGERDERNGTPVLHGAIRDITARKQREERLMVLNRVLRHNLRNDLNVVTGYADQIQEELPDLELSDGVETGGLSETVEQLSELEVLSRELKSDLTTLARMVDQVATFPADQARADAQRIQETARDLYELAEKAHDVEESFDHDQIIGPVEIRPVFEELKTTYRDEFPDATIEIASGDATVKGNENALRKIAGELLENALKHTDRESPHVTLRAEELDSGRAVICVADTGPGIPEMEREAIERGEETPLMHGSGIGLWLVNWLVTRLGGTITLEENDPRGTRVRVELSAADPTESRGSR